MKEPLKRRVAWFLPVVVLSAAIGLAGCGNSSSSPNPTVPAGAYGPSWAKFSAAFPTTPTVASGVTLNEVKTEFQTASAVSADFVSSSTAMFAPLAAVPDPPVYVVIVAEYAKASEVASELTQVDRLPSVTKTEVNGFSGIKVVQLASASVFTQDLKLDDPNAYIGAMFIGSGRLLFQAEAITTTSAEASNFLSSLKPASTSP